jgi:GrpB-like predicted nucleotidyltransferase (UPF0157 family)
LLGGRKVTSILGLERGRVELTPFQHGWAQLFDEEAVRLRQLCGSRIEQIEHVGSTAIPGMPAKPIIDMMAAVPTMALGESLISLIESNGYEYRPEDSWSERVFLANGPRSCRTHHLSLTVTDSEYWRDHLLFRDYLRKNPAQMAAYGRLKRDLAERFAADRRAYTEGKYAFVQEVLAAARNAI